MAKGDWNLFDKTQGPAWPTQDDGQETAPAFLTHLRSTDMEGQIVISLLESSGIPVVTQYPNNGVFGRVILGFSGTGVDLYVPQTMLEDAQMLLSGNTEEEEEDV